MPVKPVLSAALLVLSLSLSSIAQAQNAEAGRFYEDALKRYGSGDQEGAAIQLRNALQRDRSFLPAHLLLGKVSLESNNAPAAEVALNEALRLGASRSEVASLLASALIEQGRHVEMLADPRLQPAGLPRAGQVRLLVVRAGAQSDLGNDAAALLSLDQARNLEPDNVDVWLAEVPIRIRAGNLALAKTAVDRALRIDPRSASALYLRGSIEHVGGELRQARASYTEALAVTPDHLEALVARAGLALDLDDLGHAETDIAQLRKTHPRDPRADYLGALIAERKGDKAAALAGMRRITELIAPVPLESLRYRIQLLLLGGLAHHAVGEPQKAKPYLEMVVRHQPRNPASKLLAQILYDEGQVENGIQLLENYLRMVPQDVQAIALLAAGHSAMGRQARATQLTTRALSATDNPQVRSVLGHSLLRAGRLDDARTELEAALRRTPNSVGAAMPLAMLYLRTGETAKAVTLAQSLAKSHPGQASVHHLLGMAQASKGDRRAARASFEKALQLNRHLSEPQISLARLDFSEGRAAQAQRRLLTLHEADDRAIEPMIELANLSLATNKPDDAQRWLERAVSLSGPRETRAHFALVDLFIKRQQPDRAVEAARVLYGRRGDEPAALVAYARATLSAGDRTTAKGLLVSAGRRVGFELEPLIEVGGLQHAAGDLPGARYTLGKALELDPQHTRGLLLLSTVEMEAGDTDKASALAARLEKLRPQEAATYLLQAEIATAKGQPEAAQRPLRRAHEVQPSSVTTQRLMLNLASQGQAAAAQQIADGWLRRDPGDIAVRHLLGDLLMSGRQWAAAKSNYEELLKRRPNDARSMNNLALALGRLQDGKAALQWAERAVKAAPTHPLALDTLAWLLHQQGQHERALSLLRDARLRDPEQAEIRYHLAAVLAKLGRTAEARQELRAALARPATLESVKEAQALAQTLN